jgi:multimeric flavodoxin WrbA
MKALIINCTLKKSPNESSTQQLLEFFGNELKKNNINIENVRVVDKNVLPGVKSDEGGGDDWPKIRQKILGCEILIIGTPTWVGRLSSVAQRVIERMDALLFEKDDEGRPIAYNHVAGFAVTGNEDGAKHVIAELEAALLEIGFSIPGQAWTYFNQGASMGPPYKDVDAKALKRTHRMATNAAANLVAAAKALEKNPIPAPPLDD